MADLTKIVGLEPGATIPPEIIERANAPVSPEFERILEGHLKKYEPAMRALAAATDEDAEAALAGN